MTAALRSLDLFAGIGGFALGFKRAGIETAAFCENDPYAQAVLGKNFPGVTIFPDVRTLDARTFGQVGVATPEIICGGFPCQDISVAGRGAGIGGARSGLWREFHRLIGEIGPRWVVIENVVALRTRGLDQVLGGLAALGYDAEWHCIPASAVGAPHRRDRVWIIAYAMRPRPHAGTHAPIHRGKAGAGARDGEPKRFRSALAPGALADAADGSESSRRGVADPQRALVATGPRADGGIESRNSSARGEGTERDTLAGSTRVVADSSGDGRVEGSGDSDAMHRAPVSPRPSEFVRGRYGGDQDGADAHGTGSAQRQGVARNDGAKLKAVERSDWWRSEPGMGRVADGIPRRVDRIRCLGNAIVPQIAEIIGRAILRAEGGDAA